VSLALLFSPQGSQTVGMGGALAVASAAARAVFDEADAVLGWSVSGTAWNGPEERLNDTRQTQPCLVATSVACHRALDEAATAAGIDLRPAFVAGHSVGEYAALVTAGVLSLGDALRLVARRAELMAAQGDGGMLAVIGLESEAVAALVESVARPTELVVANDNAPGQVVISGRTDALREAGDLLRAAGARRVIPLPVSGAFHSPAMGPVADGLADAFETVAWRDATVPVVSNVTAEPESNAARLRNLLAEQVRSPVAWVASVRRMVDDGVDLFIECGPGTALTGMVRRIAPDVRVANVSDPGTLAAALDALHTPAAVAKAPA
jgi:[acyl-carrier-protein] S-malonyltransferase